MKHSIRTRITWGMIFLFLIILVLSVFSGYYLNKLSSKTGAILKENYLSVVYARNMTEGITNITSELNKSFLKKMPFDTARISGSLDLISKSLTEEKNNITEPGEDKLVMDIEAGYLEFRDTVLHLEQSEQSVQSMLYLQDKSANLNQDLLILSEMNGRAIEVKTDDAKAYSKSALTKMTILASLCFLIGMSFSFSFASWFNQRIFQLYNGIKQIVASNYDQRLFFEGRDEFYEISVVFNEMAGMLKKNELNLSVTLPSDNEKNLSKKDLEELKQMLFRIKTMEEQAAALISKLEKK